MNLSALKPPLTGPLAYPLVDIAGSRITLAGLLVAIAIVAISFLLSRLVVGLLSRLRSGVASGGGGLYILEKFAGYGISILGVLFALSSVGLNFSSFAVFAGAIGVGVGLGLQGVVKEFVSGIVLLFDDILNVGDYIELSGDVRGIVFEIGARATRIRTNDSVDVFVPNSRLIEERFTNWTLKGQTRRIHVPFAVAYGADKAKVREVVLAAAKTLDVTLPDEGARRNQVWLTGFGESALNFELVVWPALEAVKRPAAMHAAYTWAIDDALRAAGIEIPFPQRDIRIRSVFGREDDAAFEALGFKPAPPPVSTGPAIPTHNDAAADMLRPEEAPPQKQKKE